MLLYNQKRHPLTWDARGQVFKWEPFGACNVPDDLVPHVRAQKVPVDVAPVAPEIKAASVVEQQRATDRADEVLRLQGEVRVAQAEAGAARQAAEDAEGRRHEADEAAVTIRRELEVEKARATQLETDLRASEQLLAELSRKLDAAMQLNSSLTAQAAEDAAVKKAARASGKGG